jgi:hypothetical protein
MNLPLKQERALEAGLGSILQSVHEAAGSLGIEFTPGAIASGTRGAPRIPRQPTQKLIIFTGAKPELILTTDEVLRYRHDPILRMRLRDAALAALKGRRSFPD